MVDWDNIPATEGSNKDLPVFWHSALEQGQQGSRHWEWMKQQQQAANLDKQRRLQENQLQVVISEDGRKYANVDTTTPEGIIKTYQLGFASSSLADVISTPLLIESAELLLNTKCQGKKIAVFRHPVERVIGIFYYLQCATCEPTYNSIQSRLCTMDI